MKVLGGKRGEDVSLVAHGAEVAVGAVEHREVAAVVVGGVDAVVVEGAHGSARVLGDIGARVYPVQRGSKMWALGCVTIVARCQN